MQQNEGRNISYTLQRNCLLKHVVDGKMEGKLEGTRRRGRRLEQLLDYLTETRIS
jgi:hypothetical protein